MDTRLTLRSTPHQVDQRVNDNDIVVTDVKEGNEDNAVGNGMRPITDSADLESIKIDPNTKLKLSDHEAILSLPRPPSGVTLNRENVSRFTRSDFEARPRNLEEAMHDRSNFIGSESISQIYDRVVGHGLSGAMRLDRALDNRSTDLEMRKMELDYQLEMQKLQIEKMKIEADVHKA